ncbi:MAG: YggS family pyridoxal phosphate-dependent enzyme [Bacteroidetes bacterium]|nr:YggS family pyridoxal phosphate-dependent enzyme [Bacteroidota bacterium]
MKIKDNIKAVKDILNKKHCTLVAVSKTKPAETILEAYDAGQLDFGENKAQELQKKAAELPNDIRWHMIGHLQRNKVKYIAPFVYLVHSVDSMKLLREINKQGQKFNRVIPCLLQVHIAREETKFGLAEHELIELIHSYDIREMQHTQIRGLMGMATNTQDKKKIKAEFAGLRQLFVKIKTMEIPENVAMQELSMGMTSDYEIALEEGSTMVRVGSAIFGARN